MMAEKAKAVVKRLFLEEQWSPEQIAKRLKAEGNAIHVATHRYIVQFTPECWTKRNCPMANVESFANCVTMAKPVIEKELKKPEERSFLDIPKLQKR